MPGTKYLVITKWPVTGWPVTGDRLLGAWLTGENLSSAWLIGEYLSRAWLTGAWLTGTWFTGDWLTGDWLLVTGWSVPGSVTGWPVTSNWWTYTLDTLSVSKQKPPWWVLPLAVKPCGVVFPSKVLSSDNSEVTASLLFLLFCLFPVITDFFAACVWRLSAVFQVSSDQYYTSSKSITWNKKNISNSYGDYLTVLLYVHNHCEQSSWKVAKIHDMDKVIKLTKNQKTINTK